MLRAKRVHEQLSSPNEGRIMSKGRLLVLHPFLVALLALLLRGTTGGFNPFDLQPNRDDQPQS